MRLVPIYFSVRPFPTYNVHLKGRKQVFLIKLTLSCSMPNDKQSIRYGALGEKVNWEQKLNADQFLILLKKCLFLGDRLEIRGSNKQPNLYCLQSKTFQKTILPPFQHHNWHRVKFPIRQKLENNNCPD